MLAIYNHNRVCVYPYAHTHNFSYVVQLIDQYRIFKEVPLWDVLHICTTLTGPHVTLKRVFGNNVWDEM